MDVGNSQNGDDGNYGHLDRLCETYFPSRHLHHHHQLEQGNTNQAPEMDLAEHRRHLEELYKMKAQQHEQLQQQQMMLQQMYWQQMQQVNQIVQKPHQIMNSQPSSDTQSNKSEKKQTAAYLVASTNLEAADEWAWRKYGQKPIKGCTYPRSYYKCSSSKGCKAKKQVEKILVDPDVYMVTYKGEHAHMNPVQPILLPGSVLASIFGATTDPFSEMAKPTPKFVPAMAMEAAVEEEDKEVEEDNLLIPNLMMVDQDMLNSMEELKKYYKRFNNSGHDGSGSSGGLSSK